MLFFIIALFASFMAHSVAIGDRGSMLTCLTDVPPGLQERVIINVHHVPSMMSDRAVVQKELMNKWEKISTNHEANILPPLHSIC